MKFFEGFFYLLLCNDFVLEELYLFIDNTDVYISRKVLTSAFQ